MIRGRGESKETGLPVVLLGLSRRNVDRLISGQPIVAAGKTFGIPSIDSVVIFFGETEEAMEAQFREAGMLEGVVVNRERTKPDGVSE